MKWVNDDRPLLDTFCSMHVTKIWSDICKKNNNNDERDMTLVKFLLITCVKQTRGDYSEVSFDYCTLKKQWKH